MNNEVDLTNYHYLYLTEKEIKLIPEEYQSIIPKEIFVPEVFQIKGLFRVSADAITCSLLEDLSGEDFSTNWVDWFIINKKEARHD